ncbi:MAG: hypothetical protein PHP42_02085, partial [Bacteroidota bacterium]|nr:hypothetical protein [Bacteroidota bacterium]
MINSIRQITTLDVPELEPYHSLRRPIEHLQQGIFIAEAEKVTLRLLESTLTVYSILLSNDWFEKHKQSIEMNPCNIDVYVAEKKLLETIVGHRLHQSIMALAKMPAALPIDELLQSKKQQSLTVLVDGITNAENMGVIARNCVCFEVDALIVLSSSCDP